MTRKTTTLWAVLLFLVGLALRLHNLTYHSLWLDEALSVGWARLPVRAILPAGLGLVQDKHPPLYYLLLHGWIRLFGDGEVAVRGLSVLAGALAVPLGYQLVRHLCGHWAGLAAALLLAFNPFLVWYSQEVRMFGLTTTLLLAASLCLVHALGRRGGGWWLAYILLAAASFYTYLFSALVLAAHGVYALVSLIRGTARTAGQTITLVLSFAAVGALCAPLAWRAWQVGTGEAARGVPFGALPGQLLSLLRAFALWKAPWAGPWVTPLLVVLGLLALWGLATPAHCRRQKAERPAEASTPGVSPVHPAPARSETVGRCPSAFSLSPSSLRAIPRSWPSS